MRRFVRENGLSLFFGVLFLLALVGQAISGYADFNQQQRAEGLATVSFGRYVTSSSFVADVAENWQSEYLQFLLYIVATVWLAQRGWGESKSPGQAGADRDAENEIDARSPLWARLGGWRTTVYARSLSLVMGLIFVWSWVAQAIAGRVAYNQERAVRHQPPVSLPSYLASANFWSRTLQNWQSEFLAVASIAVLSIYLRQRGSPESKPVAAAHDATGEGGV